MSESESYHPEYQRVLPDGRVLEVWPLLPGTHRLIVAPRLGAMVYDDVY